MKKIIRPLSIWTIAIALALAGCATPTQPIGETTAPSGATVAKVTLAPVANRAVEDRILALDPERLSTEDVRTLAQARAPRVILLHGGIYPVHLLMVSFGRFLVGMGYPE